MLGISQFSEAALVCAIVLLKWAADPALGTAVPTFFKAAAEVPLLRSTEGARPYTQALHLVCCQAPWHRSPLAHTDRIEIRASLVDVLDAAPLGVKVFEARPEVFLEEQLWHSEGDRIVMVLLTPGF